MVLQKYVNRIKCEKYKEFSDSAFCSEYEMAVTLTKGIIHANKFFLEQDEDEKYCNENQISTIISFLGNKGVGKSSAMLSFAYFLKTYNDNHLNHGDNFWLSDNINFYVLPKIDAAMLIHGEGLFDVALAKMWDKFYEDVENSTRKNPIQDQVRRRFEDVKRSYNCFCAEKKGKNVSQLTELHELSQSLNLRDDFCELVKEFSQYMDKGSHRDSYIVFVIDDLDMVTGDTYLKLEELRLFMTIPKVIVLITADFGHLTVNIENVWVKQLKYLGDTEERKFSEYGRELFREYSVKYLAKILPRNMRIFMPDSKRTADVGLRAVYAEIVKLLFKEDAREQLTIQKLIYIFIRKQIGLSLYNKHMEDLDKGMSLREIVNVLAELNNLARDMEKEKAELWVRKEVMISGNRIEEQSHRELIKKLHDGNRKVFDVYFSQFYTQISKKFSKEVKEIGYKGTIERLVCLCNEMPEWNSLEKLLIWSYALKVKDEMGSNHNDLFVELQKHFLFDSLIEVSASGLTEPKNYIETCFNNISFSLNNEGKIHEELERLFLTLLFFDIETILNNANIKSTATVSESLSKEEGTTCTPMDNDSLSGEEGTTCTLMWDFKNTKNMKASFYWLFSNLLLFEDKMNCFVRWVQTVCSNNSSLKKKVEKSMNDKFINTYLAFDEKLESWKTKYQIKSIHNIFPLTDITVMMNIVNRLNTCKAGGERINGLYECLLRTVEIIGEVYKENEQYYNIFLTEGKHYEVEYEALFNELIAIISMEKFPKATYFGILDRADGKKELSVSY